MKDLRNTIFTILVAACALAGCDKLPENGKLEGMWQLTSIERNGEARDVHNERAYWSVQLKLIQYTHTLGDMGMMSIYDRKYSHFKREDNILSIYDICYSSSNLTEDDNNEWIDSGHRSEMFQWGIFASPDANHEERICASFIIETLNGEAMVLKSDSATLRFRKF